MIGVALLLSVVYVAGTLFAVNYYGFGEYIPLSLLLWFLFYLVLAVIMYGSLFSAIGAACSDMKEPQALMLPVMMPIILPMMLVGLIIKNPDGIIARGVSLFPPTTPMMMLLRQAMEANVPPMGADRIDDWCHCLYGDLCVGRRTYFPHWDFDARKSAVVWAVGSVGGSRIVNGY